MDGGLGSIGAPAMQAGDAAEQARITKMERLAESAGGLDSPEKVREAARQFEALLATMLVKEMRAGLEEGFFGSGPGADTFSGMLDEHLGRELTEQPLFGMVEILEDFAMQRVRNAAAAEESAS